MGLHVPWHTHEHMDALRLSFNLCSQEPDSHLSVDSEADVLFHLGVRGRVGHGVCIQPVHPAFGKECKRERVGPLLLWPIYSGCSIIHCLCQLSLRNK